MLPKGRAEAIFAAAGLALIACQAALLLATRGLNHDTAAAVAAVLPLIGWLALPTIGLLAASPRLVVIAPSAFVWAMLIATGIAMRLVWLGTPPPLEDDFNRYLWDGAMVAHGLDPYLRAPADYLGTGGGAAGSDVRWRIAAAAQATLGDINYPEMRTIYPGVAQAAFALAHLIAPFKVDGLRAVLMGAELATLWLLVVMLRALGRSPMWSLLYWWNPLAAYMAVGIVHVDALIPPLVLGCLFAQRRGRPMVGLALLGLAAGVKIWPALLAPLVLWPLVREPRRLVAGVAVMGAVLAVVMGPLLLSALRPGSGLSAYAAGWSNNNGFYAWLLYAVYAAMGSWEAAERVVRPALALATFGLAFLAAVRGDETSGSLACRALVVAAGVFYLSPAQFPWYALWFLPLAVLCCSWPLLLASATLPFYYLFFPLWPVRNGVWFFYGVAFIHSVPVLGWLLYDWYRGRCHTNARS